MIPTVESSNVEPQVTDNQTGQQMNPSDDYANNYVKFEHF